MPRHEFQTFIQSDQNVDLIRKMEKYVRCPRCKKYLRCYRRKLLSHDKRECSNVCKHCLNEYLFRTPCTTRNKEKRVIGREYSLIKYKQNNNKVKLWLSRIIDLLESNLILYKALNLSKLARKKALLCTESRYKSYKFHEPILKQIPSETNIGPIYFSRNQAQNENSTDTILPFKGEISYANEDEGHNKTIKFVKTNFETGLEDFESIATFRDDITISSTDSRFKLPKMVQEKNLLDGEEYKKSLGDKYKRVATAKRRNVKYMRVDFGELSSGTQIENDRINTSVESLNRFNSLNSLTTSISSLMDKKLKQNFGYFFPKQKQNILPLRRHKSSSELMADTIHMISERTKLERRIMDEKQKKKLEEVEKPNIAPREKLKQIQKSDGQIIEIGNKEITLNLTDQERIEKTGNKISKDIKSVQPKLNKPARGIINSPEFELKRGRETVTKESSKDDQLEGSLKVKTKKESLSKNLKTIKQEIIKDKGKTFQNESKKNKEKSPKHNLNTETSSANNETKSLKYKSKKSREQSPKDDFIRDNLPGNKERKPKAVEEKDRPLNIEKYKNIEKRAEKEDRLKEEKLDKVKVKKEKELTQKEKGKKQANNEIKSTNFKDKHINDEMVIKTKSIQKDNSDKRMEEILDKKSKREAYLKMATDDSTSKSEPDEKSVMSRPRKEEITTFKELNISQVKLRQHSQDNLILKLVKLKQSELSRVKPQRLSEMNVSPLLLRAHKDHNNSHGSCILCGNSDLELDVDNIIFGEQKLSELTELIIGQKIVKVNKSQGIIKKDNINAFDPLMFQSAFIEDGSSTRSETSTPENRKPLSKQIDPESTKGVIRYALSDRSFIDKGWTMLPTEKVVRKMNVYRMRPAQPEFDWFEHNKNKKLMHYDTGEKLAEFDDDGKGRWFYRNGRLALDYYDAEEINAQQRYVIYSNGEPDERGRPRPFTVLATFDFLGNGVVFDHSGKIRLKYNQTEGVVLDKSIGPVSHWKWHTLNDPPVLQQVMIDTQMAHKDPEILKLGGHGDDIPRRDNEEMLAIEFDNFIKEKSKKLTQTFKPFQIKMKALKINENFSLKVLDQATVYLIFRDGSTNLKLNIGMILDHKEIVDTDTAEVGEVSNSLERFPAKTDSLAGLQQSVAHAQRVQRACIERERRLRSTQYNPSADKLTVAASKPMRHPFRTAAIPSNSLINGGCYCKYRKPSSCTIYYDTRLV